MPLNARYVHTNLIARDWRALAAFYTEVFGCMLVPPERDLRGDAVERGSRVPHAHLSGVHLRLPGMGTDGPTLEVYGYEPEGPAHPPAANHRGFGHIAFSVDDVSAAHAAVLAAGGRAHGEIVTTSAGVRQVTWCYVEDPEGNLVELQRWTP
jgi:catechol 2,3-dioxygenase-like lactoylglutathione lyase family enzyme